MTRSASEYRRIYGSEERVLWVQARRCLVCGATPCVNAHTRTGGTGRKADHDTIVPLCDLHHRELDNGKRSFARQYGIDLADAAAMTEAAWQAYLNRRTQ